MLIPTLPTILSVRSKKSFTCTCSTCTHFFPVTLFQSVELQIISIPQGTDVFLKPETRFLFSFIFCLQMGQLLLILLKMSGKSAKAIYCNASLNHPESLCRKRGVAYRINLIKTNNKKSSSLSYLLD